MSDLELIQAAIGILKIGGIAAELLSLERAIEIPISDARTLRVGRGKDFWLAIVLENEGRREVATPDMPEPEVPADTQNPELIAVYALRAVIRAAQSNRVDHPHLKK